MTILLNYRPVLRQPTGIGVYANAVLPALQELPHVLIPGGEEGTAKQRLKRLAWTQFELLRVAQLHQASLIFTPAPEGYLGSQRIPQVVMVHDLRPISHPERSLQSVYFRSWVPPLLRQCRHVLTNSQFTAREIQRITGLTDEQISVIALGYESELFYPCTGDRAAIKEGSYLLHVGQAYPHKNLRRLIQAFAPVARQRPWLQLVLAGKPHPTETPRLKALVTEIGLESQVDFRTYVPYADLPALYKGALALVYPSLWEGFGLPVLEAMACGTPVITSLGSGTEEVAGDAAVLIDPSDTNILQQAVETLVDDAELRQKLRAKGLERALAFNWDSTSLQTARCLYRLCGS